VRRKFLVQHDLLAHRHPATPLARPVRHGETRGVQLGEPRLLVGDELFVTHPGLGAPPVGRHVRPAPVTDVDAELREVRGHDTTSRVSPYSPVKPREPRLSVSRARVAESPNGSRRSGWLYRDSQDSVVSSQKPTAP
jgi:hypothetical protein